MNPRLFFLLLCCLCTLLPFSAHADYETDRQNLMSQREHAENINDQTEVTRIDGLLAQLDDLQKNPPAPSNPFAVLADPDEHIFALIMKGSMIFPNPMNSELARLVPDKAERDWKPVSFEEISQKLSDQIVLIRAKQGRRSAAAPSGFTVSQSEIDAAINPSDPHQLPKIAIVIHPAAGEPMCGATPISDNSSTQ